MHDSIETLPRPLLGIMQQNVILNNLQSCVMVSELNWCVFIAFRSLNALIGRQGRKSATGDTLS